MSYTWKVIEKNQIGTYLTKCYKVITLSQYCEGIVGVSNPSSRKTRAASIAAGAGREPEIDIVHVEGKKGERLIEKAGQAVKIRA